MITSHCSNYPLLPPERTDFALSLHTYNVSMSTSVYLMQLFICTKLNSTGTVKQNTIFRKDTAELTELKEKLVDRSWEEHKPEELRTAFSEPQPSE